MARKSPEQNSNKSVIENAKGLLTEAGRRFIFAHRDSLKVAVVTRVGKVLGLFNSDNGDQNSMSSKDKMGLVQQFNKPAQEALLDYSEVTRSVRAEAGLAIDFLGEERVMEMYDIACAMQNDTSKLPTETERVMAARLAVQGLDLHNLELNQDFEVGRFLQNFLGEVLGQRLADVYLHRRLEDLVNRQGQQELVIFKESVKDFFAASGLGAPGLDILAMFNDEVILYTDTSGAVRLRLGLEHRAIAPSMRSLMASIYYPDDIESALAVMHGEFGFEFWRKLVGAVSGYGKNPEEFPDVGSLVLTREGANEHTLIPLIRASRGHRQVVNFVKTITKVNNTLNNLEDDEDSWVSLDNQEVRERALRVTQENLNNFPRFRVVLELAKQLSEANNPQPRTRGREYRKKWSYLWREGDDRRRERVWFIGRYKRFGELLELEALRNPENAKFRVDEIEHNLNTNPAFPNKEENHRAASYLADRAREVLRYTDESLWLYRTYGIRDVDLFTGDNLTYNLSTLFEESKRGDDLRSRLDKYILERVSTFDFRRVKEIVMMRARQMVDSQSYRRSRTNLSKILR